MADNSDITPKAPNTIEDKAPKPKGVIPKNTQSLVIIGVAVLMILIMWLTGGKKVEAPARSSVPPPPLVTGTDTAKVQAFKQTIQAEQQQAIRQPVPLPGLGALNGTPTSTGSSDATQPGQTAVHPPAESTGPSGSPYGQPQQAAQTTQTDPIKAEQKKRAYLSLFASNVALTYRKGEAADKLASSPGDPASGGSSSAANEQSPISQAQALRDAEALAAMGPPLPWTRQERPEDSAVEKQASTASKQATKPETKLVNPDAAEPGQFNSASGMKYVLFEGTVIDTVLINRLNGSFSGPVNCLVTHDVYSHDRQHILIPAGTRVLGEADKVNAFGQQRLAVFFHRLIMPDGYSVNLDQFKGLDQLGATALHDKVNNHYVKIFGASLAVGLLGGVAEAGTGNVFTGSTLDQARIGFGETMAMTGERIMDRFLNLMPTITIREGMRVKVYLSNDILLPDYNQHTMPSDF
jgi:type IV secretion system protein TrbI